MANKVFEGTDNRYWWRYKLNIKSKPKKKEIKAGKIIEFLNRREKEMSLVIFLIAIWASGFMAAKGWAFYSLLTIVVGLVFTIIIFMMEDWNVGNENNKTNK